MNTGASLVAFKTLALSREQSLQSEPSLLLGPGGSTNERLGASLVGAGDSLGTVQLAQVVSHLLTKHHTIFGVVLHTKAQGLNVASGLTFAHTVGSETGVGENRTTQGFAESGKEEMFPIWGA